MKKRINLSVESNDLILVEEIKARLGFDDIPSTIRACIRMVHNIKQNISTTQSVSHTTQSVPIIEKTKKIRKWTDEQINEYIETNSTGLMRTMCLRHPDQYYYRCGCRDTEKSRESFIGWCKEQMIDTLIAN